MIDDLVVFRQTVEARFASPALAREGAPLRRSSRRVSQEAQNPDGEPVVAGASSFLKRTQNEEPPGASLLLPSDIDRGPARSKARVVADNYVAERRSSWGVREYHELRGEEYPGPMGTEVRYKVYQDGLEVMGLELRVEVDSAGATAETGNNYLPMGRADLSQPELAPDEAVRRSGIVEETDVASAAMSAHRVLFAGSGSDEPEVGFSVSFDGDTGASSAIVRAADGQPLARNFARR